MKRGFQWLESELTALAADFRDNPKNGETIWIEVLVADWVMKAREKIADFRA